MNAHRVAVFSSHAKKVLSPRPLATLALALAATLLLVFSVVTVAGAGDVTDTWKRRVTVEPQGASGQVGVLLFIHGCDGLGPGPGALYPGTLAWVQTITQAGYRFVAPDSWARGTWSRPNGCPTATTRPPLEDVLKIRLLRIEEIAYAVARLQEDPTVDKNRIILLGHSEGGIAVATAPPPSGVRGIIVSGWTCHASIPLGMGIAAPPSIPVLAINFERDTVISVQGRCSEFFPGRTDAREIIINGSGHQMTGGSAEARQAVVDFLKGLEAGR